MPHHLIRRTPHEVERNNDLIAHFTDGIMNRPAIYPSAADERSGFIVANHLSRFPLPASGLSKNFRWRNGSKCINQFPKATGSFYWAGLITGKNANHWNRRWFYPDVEVLAGSLSFLQSAAPHEAGCDELCERQRSASFYFCRQCPVTAIFCSTAPVRDIPHCPIDQPSLKPLKHWIAGHAGWHGTAYALKQHFRCAMGIDNKQIIDTLPPLSWNSA